MATEFFTRCMRGKYQLRLVTDSREHYMFVRGAVRHCVADKCVTVADVVRAMSDEELAAFLAERAVAEWLVRMKEREYIPTQNQMRVARQGFYIKILEWLKQEAQVVPVAEDPRS